MRQGGVWYQEGTKLWLLSQRYLEQVSFTGVDTHGNE